MEQFILPVDGLVKLFLLASLAFLLAMIWNPVLTDFLYKYKMGKRIRKTSYDNKKAPIFYSLHKEKENTPTMGGLLIWITAGIVTLIFNLDRAGTYLPGILLPVPPRTSKPSTVAGGDVALFPPDKL